MSAALIVGSNGQDGRLLHSFLAAKGYVVDGLSRQGLDTADGARLPSLDVADHEAVRSMLESRRYDEIYYLAAFHHSAQQALAVPPGELWNSSMAVNATGPVCFLEAVRRASPDTRFFYAGSCLAFGQPDRVPQNEETPLRPDCVYGISKAAGTHAVRLYRETHGVFASAAILFNHESHLRPGHFLSRKIVSAAWRIRCGLEDELVLADLDAKADWGYAPDFVEGFWKMLQAGRPGDFVLATGMTRSVRDWVEIAFALAGLDWQRHVRQDAGLAVRRRPLYVGNIEKSDEQCGWRPTTSFERMVELMFEHERRQS